MLQKLRESHLHRGLEIIAIFLFTIASLSLLFANPIKSSTFHSPNRNSPEITAQASAMPHQGWAPLEVYLSGFGSRSTTGSIVKYEWDLDGNGTFDTDATRDGGYVRYTYAKPGEYSVTLRVTDDRGLTSTDSLLITVRHPASSSVDYWSIFDDTRVQRVDIFLDTPSWNRMWTDPPAKVQVRADAVIFGERLEDVGFRMRGQFSLRESGEKKPWKIDTDAYIDGQEYHNLRQLMFINNIGDPTMVQEKLAYDMLSFAGVPASHVSFVELWIDLVDDSSPPIFWGVYTMVERVDKKFIANRFGRDFKGGNLYKASHAQRGPMDLIYYGEKIDNFPTQNGQYAYGKMTNIAENDYSDVVNLARVIDGVEYKSPEDFARALEEVFNVDIFLRYMAVMVAVSSWDYYPYTGNNFFLYNNPETGKFEWIPWDLTWGGNPRQPLFEREGFGLLDRAPLYDRVFEVPRYRLKYAAYLDLLARYWFTGENISREAEKFNNMIDPFVTQETGDKMIFGDTAMFPYEAFENNWRDLGSFAGERSAFILRNLAQAYP